ncbi:MAG: hypothetical protein ABIH38_05710 [Patescibacteria group bacterium]
MNKKSKNILVTSFFILAFFIFPLRIKAATTFQLLPNCDVSVYQVEKNGDIRDGICEPYKDKGGCVKPADYNPGTGTDGNGAILQILSYRACGFDDFLQLFINAFQLGLGVLGIVVLFFFIWGGFGFIIGAGRSEKIQEAKNTLKGAFIGMLIVLTSWVFVNFYIFAFASGENNPQGKLFYQENGGFLWWGKSCHDTETYQETCNKYNLHQGCGGEKDSLTDVNIKKVQQKLNELGCDCGPVSGCFTPDTTTCVTKFQFKNSFVLPFYLPEEPAEELPGPYLPVAEKQYGVVDADTWEAIFFGGQACK